MGFRREAFDLVGGFDERLGAGAAGCSEDSELWYRLLAAGHRCRYEPAVVVTHHHRGNVDALRAQSKDYIEGHVAALFVQYARFRHPGELVRAVGIMPRHVVLRLLHARRKGTLTAWEELRGYLRGLRHAGYARRAVAAPDVSPDVVGARPSREMSPSPPADRRSFLRANPYGRPYTDGLFFREKMRAIHHVTADHPAAAVLEIGGGRSGLTASLYPGASVITVDVDTTYGAEAVNAGARRRFVGADATSLPFDGDVFDAVTLFDVVEHIDDDRGAIAEALRVLRPGGRLLLTTPSCSWRFPYYRAFRRICPTDAEVMADWGHVRRGYSVAELDRLAGHRHDLAATFISPVTVLAHDLSFSNLGRVVRRGAATLVAPVAWIGYAAHRPHHEGNEIAVAWTKRG